MRSSQALRCREGDSKNSMTLTNPQLKLSARLCRPQPILLDLLTAKALSRRSHSFHRGTSDISGHGDQGRRTCAHQYASLKTEQCPTRLPAAHSPRKLPGRKLQESLGGFSIGVAPRVRLDTLCSLRAGCSSPIIASERRHQRAGGELAWCRQGRPVPRKCSRALSWPEPMALPKVTALPMRPGRQVHTWRRLGRARCFPSASAVRALDRPDQSAGLLDAA